MRNLILPPIVWLAAVIAILVLHDWFPIAHFEPETWRSASGLLLFALALGTTIWHKRLFKKEKTNINTFDSPQNLVKSGLFKYIRNPMYLGFVASLAALALLSGAVSPWLIVLGFFVLSDRWYIPFEEQAMHERFGVKYDDYRSHTRRWI